MPIKGKGKFSKQTNKLGAIDSIAAAFNIGLFAAEPFLTCRALMNSKQRKSKQTKNWGVYLVHLIYCFYWKEKLRLTWRHSPVQCQIYCRFNTRPDCLPLTFVRAESSVWAACWVVKSAHGVSHVNHQQPSSWLRTTIDKIPWELCLILVCNKGKHRSLEWYDEKQQSGNPRGLRENTEYCVLSGKELQKLQSFWV